MQPQDQLTVSLKALQRARTTLEDFALSYLPYLHLDPLKDFLAHLDVLVWLEASIYQLDEDNEAICRSGSEQSVKKLAGESCIRSALEQLGVWDERVAFELQQADEYWCLERHLAAQMLSIGVASKQGASGAAEGLQLPEVMRAHEAKSFDYRLLFLVLHRRVGAPYDDALLSFLRIDERLVDIGDDLTDYEDDVEANSFNIFRAFVFMYGREAQLKLIELISELEATHARLLATLPKDLQQHYWSRHEQASCEPGSGRWCFPTPIYDEAAFRASLSSH